MSAPPAPPRPSAAFRVGVTGTRRPPAAALPRLREEVRRVLGRIRDAVEAAAEQDAATRHGTYARDAVGRVPVALRLVSPLAEGADRLVAQEALDLGYLLECPLPFSRAEYERDFTAEGSREEFGALLDRAGPRVLELDGARGAHEAASYEAVGRLVVRNCDLLIALWDGAPAHGRGGTAEIVAFAARSGPPVLWIPMQEAEPVWIDGDAALRTRGAQPRGAAAHAELGIVLAQALEPPPDAQAHGLVGRTADRLRPAPALPSFLGEPAPAVTFPWSAYDRLLGSIAGRHVAPMGPAPLPVNHAAWTAWEAAVAAPDARAVGFAARYRSSYVYVLLFAAAALLAAGLALAYKPLKLGSTAVECALLLLILVIVAINRRSHWHRRWISCRLLGELARKQQALALLGWSLPLRPIRRRTTDEHERPHAWIGWYFAALVRAAPLRTGRLDHARVEQARAILSMRLLSGQADYHARRAARAEHAAHRLGNLGEGLFLGTLILTLFKLVLIGFAVAPAVVAPLGVLAVALPGLAAAAFGLRAYSELEVVAGQSRRMAALIAEAEAEIAALPPDLPLASQELAAAVAALTTGMMAEVEGWLDLFRTKPVEAG